MATRKAKKNIMQKQLDSFKTKLKNFNEEAIHVSDNLVDTSIAAGTKWQKLLAKTIDQGTDLMGKQQDFLLTTLEEMKGQFIYSKKRMVKLFETEEVKKTVKKPRAKRVVKTAKAKLEKKVTKAKTIMVSAKTANTKDDLTKIDGIGKKFALLLNEAGIMNFEQLAGAKLDDLKKLLAKAGPMFKSYDPTRWIEQAKLVVKG
jgi:predicted flap endonuclease-1-like 5' DNA nuclease